MAAKVTSVDLLQEYVKGVMSRAEHHARGVSQVALTLAGAILWKMDDAPPIEVVVRTGEMKNVLWVHIGGQRYAFSYNHGGAIEMRLGSWQGDVVASFDDSMSAADVVAVFDGL